MDINKFTQKSLDAVNQCEKIAYEYGNQEVDQEHLLYALISQENGLIVKMIEKMGIDVLSFEKSVQAVLDKKTKVQGGDLRISKELNRVLISAEDELKQFGGKVTVTGIRQNNNNGFACVFFPLCNLDGSVKGCAGGNTYKDSFLFANPSAAFKSIIIFYLYYFIVDFCV